MLCKKNLKELADQTEYNLQLTLILTRDISIKSA